MLRWVLAGGVAVILAGCGASAAPASQGGVPELVTRCVDGREVEGPVAACTRAIEAKSGSPELRALVYHTRAQAQCFSGEFDAGIADEGRALALVPNFPEAYAMRAQCRMSKGEADRAQEDYQMVLKLAPDVPGYHSQAARIDNWVGDHENALRQYDEAIRLAPASNTDIDARAKTLFNLGRYDEAAAEFKTVIRMTPGDEMPVLWLHLSRLRAGKPDQREFQANEAALRLTEWPKPIFDLFAGRTTLAALRAAAKSEEDGRCEVAIFGGEYLLTRSDPKGAQELLAEALLVCSSAEHRYLTAWAELKRLDPSLRGPG